MQSERKGGDKKKGGKGKKEEKKEMNPSVSAIIMNDKSDPPDSTNTVPITKSNNTVCFYIACEHKWMLNSGCTDHITNDISDFSEYRLLPTPHKAYFCYEAVALLPHGSGFGVQSLNFADAKRGKGYWSLASVRALRLPSVVVQIFQMEDQSMKFRVKVRCSVFGVRARG